MVHTMPSLRTFADDVHDTGCYYCDDDDDCAWY